jgi:hypothetical protein
MHALFQFVASLFRMDERAWDRHANPWSVWTRIAAFPAMMLALWSAHWIGWYAVLPIAGVAVFLGLNPRLFPPPVSTRSWASRAVMGERVYLLRVLHPIPVEHSNAATLLGAGAAVGGLLMVAGLLTREPHAFVAGGAAAFLFKLWFVDRMVWLYDEMSERVEEYRTWLR